MYSFSKKWTLKRWKINRKSDKIDQNQQVNVAKINLHFFIFFSSMLAHFIYFCVASEQMWHQSCLRCHRVLKCLFSHFIQNIRECCCAPRPTVYSGIWYNPLLTFLSTKKDSEFHFYSIWIEKGQGSNICRVLNPWSMYRYCNN